MAQNSVFERFARAGYLASGLVHLIIGYIAIRLVLGGGGGTVDQSGALATLASTPGGPLTLWVAVVAFTMMGLWRLVETILGRATDPKSQGLWSEAFDRAKAFALSVTYFVFAFTTLGFARGAGKSSGAQESGISVRLMQTPGGKAALVAGGVAIVAVGGYHVYKGATRSFLEDLEGSPGDAVRRLGIVGYVAKGIVLAGVGVLLVVAALRSQPDRATGLDGALKTLLTHPAGAVMLVLAGLGIIAYGLYSFVMARHTKM
ncbi:DUF1206 domain-containing protein [Rhodococcus olei]|uniref:DUF1206 domain-containing protein n=1 Tax=Rhodococcus olei TaxID=2161675 RepID=A0ABP8PJA1_9NOCA